MKEPERGGLKGIAGALLSIFNEEIRQFLAQKSVKFKRFGYSTRKGNDIFLHILKNVDKVELQSPDKIKVKKVVQVDSGQKTDFSKTDNQLVLDLNAKNQIPYVIRIRTNTNVESIDVIQ